MAEQLFQHLESKISQALELIELLRMQLEEYQEKNRALEADCKAYKTRQNEWENSLAGLLKKLEGTDLSMEAENPGKRAHTHHVEKEEVFELT